MKKLATIMVVVFAFAMTMNVAFAGRTCRDKNHNVCPCPDQSNEAYNVSSGISATAISGGNVIEGGYVGAGTIVSGPSIAKAKGISAVNSNVKVGFSMGSQRQTNKAVGVDSGVTAAGQSGVNEIKGFVVNGGYVGSGASVAKAKGITLVNTNVKFGGGFGF